MLMQRTLRLSSSISRLQKPVTIVVPRVNTYRIPVLNCQTRAMSELKTFNTKNAAQRELSEITRSSDFISALTDIHFPRSGGPLRKNPISLTRPHHRGLPLIPPYSPKP